MSMNILKRFKSITINIECHKGKQNLKLQSKLHTIKTKKAKMFVQQTFKLPKVKPVVILAIADCIRTSLGPRGMDKMIKDSKG